MVPRAGAQTPTSMRASEDLARRGRSDYAERLSGRQREVDVLTDDFLLAGRRYGGVLDDERPRRRVERHRLGLRRQVTEQF